MASVTVRSGDNLTTIATRNNITVAELMAANPDITNPDLIYAGQVIRLPGGENRAPAGVTPAQAPPIPVTDTQAQIREYAAANYGYLASYLGHEEIGPILEQAASEGWSSEKLFGALHTTDWWQSTSSTSRQWDAMVSSDPASAQAQVERRYQDLSDYAYRTGLSVSESALQQISQDSLRLGWSDNQTTDALFAQSSMDAARIGSDLSATQSNITQIFSSYGLSLPASEASQLATDVILGRQSIEGVQEIATRRAITAYPQLADVILSGDLNARVYNYQNTIAQYTGIPADSIDLFNDARWSHVLTGPAPMNLNDLKRELRGTPEYGASPEGRGQAASMAMLLTEQMGMAAY
jgi:LysM repeat protein